MSGYSSTPQPLGTVLQALIDQMGLRRRIDAARIVEAWAIIAGPQINSVTDSAWVKGGTLFVRISSAAWRQELHLRRHAWCDRINDCLGARLVQEIVFR